MAKDTKNMNNSLLAKELVNDIIEQMPKEVFILRGYSYGFDNIYGVYTNLEKVAKGLYELGYESGSEIKIFDIIKDLGNNNDLMGLSLLNKNTCCIMCFQIEKMSLNKTLLVKK